MKKQQAFTLIELSIALVIISLIVGGVLVGRDLIKAAQLRAVLSDKERFETATNTFRLKYNCLPGDCNNAVSLGFTANGNGNRQVGIFSFSLITPAETFRFWQHLGQANLIAGTYSGVAGGGGSRDTTIGVNVPASAAEGSGYTIEFLSLSASSGRFDANGHWLFWGTENNYNGTIYETAGYVINAIDAYNLDAKTDDGAPGTGTIMSTYDSQFSAAPHYTTCASSTVEATAVYTTNITDIRCSMQFKMGF